MEALLAILKQVPELLNRKMNNWMVLILVVVISIGVNKDEIYNKFYKKDITKEYIAKTFAVENDLKSIKREFKPDNASVMLLHNGTVTLSRLHLLKFTMLYSVGENSSLNKQVYRNIPLSPWVRNFEIMIRKGYFLIEDCQYSNDPLVRNIYKNTGRHTIIFLPVLDKNDYIVGFVLLSYKNIHKFTPQRIKELQRYVDIVESHLY